jgi:hypothetical protein
MYKGFGLEVYVDVTEEGLREIILQDRITPRNTVCIPYSIAVKGTVTV